MTLYALAFKSQHILKKILHKSLKVSLIDSNIHNWPKFNSFNINFFYVDVINHQLQTTRLAPTLLEKIKGVDY